MFELLALLIVGIVMIWLGYHCLLRYKEVFLDNPKLTITWDLLVQALGAGTSWGRLGVTLLTVGIFFCGMSLLLLLGVLLN